MTINIINKVVHGGPAYKVPAHLNFGQYVIDKLRDHSTNPDAIALINGDTDEKTTYNQLLQYIVNIAFGLKCAGVKRGDIVGICGERSVEYIVSLIATMCCGATATVFSEHNTSSEMDRDLNISRPETLICSKLVLDQHLNTFKSLKFVKKIMQMKGGSPFIAGEPLETNIDSYEHLSRKINEKEYEVTDVEGCTDGLLILYSSGTTGMPKGVVLSHLSMLYAAATLDNDDQYHQNLVSILSVVPWYHGYGLMTIILAIVLKRQFIYCSSFNIQNYLSVIQKYKPSVLAVVPSIIVTLAKSSIVENYDVSSVNAIMSASAPLNPSTVQEVINKFQNCVGVLNGYGMTEIMSPIKHTEIQSTKPNTVGIPVPGVKIKIVDIETETKLGPKQNGEIRIQGPLLMQGYINNEIATKEAMDKEGYLKTGDIGYYDEDGYFFVVDRLKNLIKYKGFQVSPTEVESVLLQHPQVEECGVVGTPDGKAGELPTAFVVVKEGKRVSEKDLLDFSNCRLSSHKRIRGGIIFVDKIPKTKTGKILHNVLKNRLRQKKTSKL